MNTARLLGIAAVCTLAVGSSASARDLKTVGGTVFKNINLVSKSTTGIQISHDDGLIFLDYRNLDAPDREEFGYNETAYVEGLKQNVEVKKQAQAQAQAVQQAKLARARAEAAEATAWKTHSAMGGTVVSVLPAPAGYAPGYAPTNQTGLQYSVESPGFNYGGYYYPGAVYPGSVYPAGAYPAGAYPGPVYGPVYPTVPQTYYGNGTVPYIRNPYPYSGTSVGPVIIRRR